MRRLQVEKQAAAETADAPTRRSSSTLSRSCSAASERAEQQLQQQQHDAELASGPIDTDNPSVHILSRLDDRSYRRAVIRDSHAISDAFLLPVQFPWHKPRIPLLRTVPRDIDEMHGIVYCDDDGGEDPSVPFDGGNGGVAGSVGVHGPFGYGRYENGQGRKGPPLPGRPQQQPQRCDGPGAALAAGGVLAPLEYYDRIRAAARRAENDPGVVELSVSMPPPLSVEAALLARRLPGDSASVVPSVDGLDEEALKRTKALVEAERAEITSSMPFHWEKADRMSTFNPPAFVDESDDDKMTVPERGNGAGDSDCEGELEYRKAIARDRRKRKRLELAKACARKWKVSVKAGGVSSRTTLFGSFNSTEPSSGVSIQAQADDNAKQASLQPMLCMAVLPPSVQQGQSVTTEVAATMDEEGLADSLGTYDCRITNGEKPTNAKQQGGTSGRAKKVQIGRTRLVWTKLNEGDDPLMPSTRNRAIYNSLITGQRLEVGAQKRPREVLVGVRLNGHIVMEDAKEDVSSASSLSGRKRRSSRQEEMSTNKPTLVCTTDRTPDAVDAAFLKLPVGESFKTEGVDTTSSLPSPHKSSNAICTLDGKALVTSTIKRIEEERKVARQKVTPKAPRSPRSPRGSNVPSSSTSMLDSRPYIPMKYGSGPMLKHIPPRIVCLPVEDGAIQVVCIAPGSMQGSSIHNVLTQAAKKDANAHVCSICWNGDDEERGFRVQECIDCGLLAHLECCFDKGERVPGENEEHAVVSSMNGHLKVSQSADLGIATEPSTSVEKPDSQVEQAGGAAPVSDSRVGNSLRQMDAISSGTGLDKAIDGSPRICSKWRCVVCQGHHIKSMTALPSADTSNSTSSIALKKPRRSLKVPARFVDDKIYEVPAPQNKKSTKPRPSFKCTLCPHSGGAMSVDRARSNRDGQPQSWTHDICRVWGGAGSPALKQMDRDLDIAPCQGGSLPLFSSFSRVCALCGMGDVHSNDQEKEEAFGSRSHGRDGQHGFPHKDSNTHFTPGLIKCAARGCHVMFHPLCALLVTKLRADENSEDSSRRKAGNGRSGGDDILTKWKARDARLCNQYTLQILKLTRTEGAYGSLQGSSRTSVLPVAFCGFHNPQRDESFLGCPPGGDLISSAMRIPPTAK